MEENQYYTAPVSVPEEAVAPAEQEIDLFELCFHVLAQWRTLLIALLLGLLVVNAFGILSSWKNVRRAKASTNLSETSLETLIEAQEAKLAVMEQALTEEQLQKVRALIRVRETYLQCRQVEAEYYDKSILADVDYRHVPTRTVRYAVDASYEAQYPVIATKDHTSDVLDTYMQVLTDAGVYSALAEKMGWELESRYLQELVSVDVSDAMLSITVIADTQENCDRLTEAMMEQVDATTAKLQAVYGDYSVVLFSDTTLDSLCEDIVESKQKVADAIVEYENKITALSANLSTDEKDYYEALVACEELTEDSAAQGDAAPVVIPQMKYLHLKYMLLGAVLGLFVAVVSIMFRYILSGTLHMPEDIKTQYGVELLGCVTVQQPKRGAVDKLLLRLFHREQSEEKNANALRMAETQAQIIMEREALKRICITGSFQDEQGAQIVSQLQQALAAQAEIVISEASPLTDANALNELVAADGAILIESAERSKAADIRREVALCRANGTAIVGAIVLR
jgi:hypothetical protein